MTTAPSCARSTPDVTHIETNGLDVISEPERHGTPAGLFRPWFASNITVMAVGYGAFVLGFGLDFWQGLSAVVVGTVASFLLCGFVAVAGKRGSAPTLVLSRAVFGIRGNAIPAAVSWILTVGWETVLTVLGTLATATVWRELGWGGSTFTKLVALLLIGGITVVAGVFGFSLIMRLQTVFTVLTAALTAVYMAIAASHISWHAVAHTGHAGGFPAWLGATMLIATAFGIGWTNCAADYSRYLPRSSSGAAVVGWTTFGASLAALALVIFGLLLAGSDARLAEAVAADPIGALTTILPTWLLLPFLAVALIGLIAASVLGIYSSGLSLLSLGLPTPRWAAACLDGVLMTSAAGAVVFFAHDFLGPFQAFLATMGVPISAWCGLFLADVARRRHGYRETDLFSTGGRYGAVQPAAMALLALGTVVGWGLVTSAESSGWLAWQGYLLDPLGLGGRHGEWAFAGLGILAALAVGFVGGILRRPAGDRTEPVTPAASPR